MEYFVIKLTVLAIGGIATLVTAARIAARERARRAMATARIRGAQTEVADLTVITLRGIVRVLDEPLLAPLSGRPCVAHRTVARKISKAGLRVREGRAHETEELVSETMVRFVLVTQDGDVVVDGDHAEIADKTVAIIPRKRERDVAFLVAGGLNSTSITAFAFEEAAIEAGMTVDVCGVARVEITQPDGEAGFRDAPTAIRLVADDRHPLTIGQA